MSTTTRDALDDKVNQVFAGKCVRKDLVRAVKVGANVPVFVMPRAWLSPEDRDWTLPVTPSKPAR